VHKKQHLIDIIDDEWMCDKLLDDDIEIPVPQTQSSNASGLIATMSSALNHGATAQDEDEFENLHQSNLSSLNVTGQPQEQWKELSLQQFIIDDQGSNNFSLFKKQSNKADN